MHIVGVDKCSMMALLEPQYYDIQAKSQDFCFDYICSQWLPVLNLSVRNQVLHQPVLQELSVVRHQTHHAGSGGIFPLSLGVPSDITALSYSVSWSLCLSISISVSCAHPEIPFHQPMSPNKTSYVISVAWCDLLGTHLGFNLPRCFCH